MGKSHSFESKIIKTGYLFVVIAVILIFTILIINKPIQQKKVISEAKVLRLSQEYKVVNIKRISFCSVREFGGRTALGVYSSEKKVAVSRDLQEYLGWYVSIPDVAPELFLVADLTHDRFNSTIDVYSFLPPRELKELGTFPAKAVFVSPEGMRLLGEL